MISIRSKKLCAAVSTLILLFAIGTGWSATYFIDYSSGNDLGNGTSKATPWKRCPGMQGFAGTYSHAASDQFIFKGGVTWPNACFRMVVASGGSAGQYNYYGVDKTWYAGGSWARPIFSAGGARITSGSANGYVSIDGLSYITFDNIEFSDFYWDVNDANWQDAKMLFVGQASYVTCENLYFHGWTHSTYAAGGRDIMYCIIGYPGAPYNPGSLIDNCIFDGSSSSGDSGSATYGGICEIRKCVAHDMPVGIESTGVASAHSIHDNLIYNISHSFDSGQHEDATLMFGGGQMYNNIVHDLYTGAGPIYSAPAWEAGEMSDILIYNNVFWNFPSTNPCVNVQLSYRDYTGTIRIFNNTLFGGNGATQSCVGTVNTGYTISNMIVQNNQFITSYPTGMNIRSPVIKLTADHNVQQVVAQATAQGYTSLEVNAYSPSSSSAITIDAGVSETAYFTTDILGVARPQGAKWDCGAYEFMWASGAPLAPSGLRIK